MQSHACDRRCPVPISITGRCNVPLDLHRLNENVAMASGNRQDSALDTESRDRIETRCPACLREYRIRRSRIPKGAAAVHCKACGQKIRLPKGVSATVHSRRHQSPAPGLNNPRFRLDLMTPEKRQAKRRFALIPSRSAHQPER
jgi:predicted Zn finger-like uncharacterized protein